MRNETPTVECSNVVVEHSETDDGNVSVERMFHMRGVVFVPVFYEREVRATSLDDACKQFADSIAKNRDGGVSSWAKRSRAFVSNIGDLLERSNPAIRIVPKRYRFPGFGA